MRYELVRGASEEGERRNEHRAPRRREDGQVLMDFYFTENLDHFHKVGRELGELVAVSGATGVRGRDGDVFGPLAENGVTRAYVPKEKGGMGLSALEVCALMEGFGEGSGDAGLALAVGVHGLLVAVPVWKLGTEAQHRSHLANGVPCEPLSGMSLLEVDGGAATANLTTRAVRKGNRWVLHGVKPMVVNGPYARSFLVTAVTDAGADPMRLSAFLVGRDAPGLTVRPASDPAGLLGGVTADLVLDGCELDGSALLGTAGRAGAEVLPLLTALDRALLTAAWIGVMRAVIARTTELARTRESFSRPLVSSQTVRAMLADMRIRAELCGGLVHRAAWELDTLPRPPRQDGAVAKLAVSRAVRSVMRDAVEILGPQVAAADPLVGRAHRDALLLGAAGGPEVTRSVIADSLLEL